MAIRPIYHVTMRKARDMRAMTCDMQVVACGAIATVSSADSSGYYVLEA